MSSHKRRTFSTTFLRVFWVSLLCVAALFFSDVASYAAQFSGLSWSNALSTDRSPVIGGTSQYPAGGLIAIHDATNGHDYGNANVYLFCKDTSTTHIWLQTVVGVSNEHSFASGSDWGYTDSGGAGCPTGRTVDGYVFNLASSGSPVTNCATTPCDTSTGTHVWSTSGTLLEKPATYIEQFVITPVNGVCSLSDLASSYVGTTLSVRIKSATFPSGGWKVYAPDPGAVQQNGTPTMTIGSADTVDGSPGYYYKTITVTPFTATTLRIFDSSQTCSLGGNIVNNQINTTPSAGEATNPVDNTDCGSWWHIKCHFMAALHDTFVPSSSLQQWNTLEQNVQTKPPFSVMSGAAGYASTIYSDDKNLYSGGCSSQGVPSICQQGFDTPDGQSHQFDFFTAAGDLMSSTTGGVWIYTLCRLSIWVTFSLAVWNWLSKIIGGKGGDGEIE